MQFLSWDIGIKNLAYNIIEYHPEANDVNEKYLIKKWGIINLVNEVDEIADNAVQHLTCSGTMKSGKKCEQKAKYLDKNNKYVGYCAKHGKEINVKKNTLELITKTVKCQYHIKKKDATILCTKNGYWLKDDNPYIGYCQTHLKSVENEEKDNEHVHKYYLCPKRAKTVKQHGIKELAVTLFEELHKFDNDFLNVDEIVIENQPVFKNPTMKSIQMLLYSYFVLHGLMTNKVKNISFFMAGKKLDGFTGDKDIANKFAHIKSEYKQTKNSAVLYCQTMIKDTQSEWYQFLQKQSKKDDLADAFLTGCCYAKNNYGLKYEKEKLKNEKLKKDIIKKDIIKKEKKTKL